MVVNRGTSSENVGRSSGSYEQHCLTILAISSSTASCFTRTRLDKQGWIKTGQNEDASVLHTYSAFRFQYNSRYNCLASYISQSILGDDFIDVDGGDDLRPFFAMSVCMLSRHDMVEKRSIGPCIGVAIIPFAL